MPRSIEDWVKRAAAASGGERARELAEAEAIAVDVWTLRDLLDHAERHGVSEPAWRLRIADRLLEAAIAEQDAWGFRDAARIRAEQGDLEAARAALEAGLAALDASAPAYTWTNLAESFVQILDDRDAARTCLDRSRDPSLGARCDIAKARAELLGEQIQAMAILAGLQLTETHDAWTLANAWRALGEDARASEVLDAALADATTLADVLTLARARASHEDFARRDRALDLAGERAASAADWLQIAEVCQDVGLPARVRIALNCAEALPLDDETRPRVAAAWLWLGEAARAEAIGPRGVHPEAIAPALRPLPGFDPSPSALFDDLRSRATEAMLRDIAGADYGEGYDKHLVALRDLVRTGLLPRPMAWEPGEVVRLRRWAEGDRVDHVQRALCCTILYLNGDDGHNDEPILVESAVVLGEPAVTGAERLLAWRFASADEYQDTDRFAALWALALLCAARDPDDPRLETLAIHAEAAVAAGASADDVRRYCVRDALWIELSERWFAPRGATARWHALV